MAGLVFIALCIAGAFVLAMRRAPLWAWAAALAAAVLAWRTGLVYGDWHEPAFNLVGLLAWVPVIVLAGLSVPAIRRVALIGPVYHKIKGILPKVSATEQEALNAGTIGFDAELFSGQPDWEKLRAVPPITLTEEEKAFLDGPTNELCRMVNDWAIRHNDKEIPEEVWSFVKKHGFLGMLISKEHGGLGFSAAGAVADPRSHRLALARRGHHRHGAELAGARRADREVRHARAEAPLPAAPRQGPRGALLRADRADLRLRRRHHARRRLRDEGPARGQGGHRHPRSPGRSATSRWRRRRRWSGLAVRVIDPENLLGRGEDLGITVVLVPADHPGVEIGRRHLPSGAAFPNGPIWGTRRVHPDRLGDRRREDGRPGLAHADGVPGRRPLDLAAVVLGGRRQVAAAQHAAPTPASASSSTCRSARWRGSRSRSRAWSRTPT